MEAGVDILETEELLDLGKEAARTTYRGRCIGDRSGHEAHHARILGLAQGFVLEVRDAHASGKTHDELYRLGRVSQAGGTAGEDDADQQIADGA